jgi:bla regulator protein blaR1
MDSVKLAIPLSVLLFAGLAAPAAANEGSDRTVIYPQRNQDAYVLSMGENSICTNASLTEMQALRRRFPGDFLWVRRARKTYLLRDQATIAEARALFAPLRALDPAREAVRRLREPLESREAVVEREERALDREADRFSDDEEEEDQPSDRKDLDARQEALRDRQRALEREEKHVDALEEELDRKEEALEKQAEKELWRLIDASITRGLARPIGKD